MILLRARYKYNHDKYNHSLFCFWLFYGATSTAALVVRNEKRACGIVSADSMRREFVVCLKIVQGYSLGRDSELMLTNDKHESWRVLLLVEWKWLRYRGCRK